MLDCDYRIGTVISDQNFRDFHGESIPFFILAFLRGNGYALLI
jgi:hypothetical protein